MSKASKALLTDALREYMRVIAATGGKRGGKARARKLSARRRREIARQGARAKWAKVKRAVTAVALALLLSEELVKYVWHHPEVEHVEATVPVVRPPVTDTPI